MQYHRRYLQFNDLVFDKYDMISESSAVDVKSKMQSTAITFGHGSYVPFKADYMFYEPMNISMVLRLSFLKLACEHRPYYRDFVLDQLSKPGKLWAIQNNEIVWTNAYVSNKSEDTGRELDELTLDLEFVAYEGVWHKADMLKTFLLPFDICSFMDCLDFQTINPCMDNPELSGDCCTCMELNVQPPKDDPCKCCVCDRIDKDMALCFHTKELQRFYNECESTYRLVYDCEKANEFFTNETTPALGQRFCTANECNSGVIAGRFYSTTSTPTTSYELVLHGSFHNPIVRINDVSMQIMGDYDGFLTINGKGEVYWSLGDVPCCEELIDVAKLKFPDGQIAFTIYPRWNKIMIDTGSCCGTSCVYINIDNLTT